MAHLRLIECRRIAKKKLLWKTALVKSLYKKGWKKKDILNLYRFIDWLITLPKGMEKMFHDDIRRFEEDMKMPFITTAERIGMEKGVLKERAESERKRLEEKREMARKLRERGMDVAEIREITGLTEAELEGWYNK